MAKRFLDFLAGAAVGAAVVAYLKSDKEKLAAILDKAEAALSEGRVEAENETKE
ncbi:MAG: hypothetical protein MJY88_01270 [Bacteroidales bacterium]|nr:hypothetical protein [Bacteroidales bacterium]